jgi:hypothetical protein
MLVHLIVELFISRDLYSDELFVSSVSDLISVAVEYLDNNVPFVKVLHEAEPAKVSYDDDWFLRGCPLQEGLEVPWGVLVSGFCQALVELD